MYRLGIPNRWPGEMSSPGNQNHPYKMSESQLQEPLVWWRMWAFPGRARLAVVHFMKICYIVVTRGFVSG